MKNFKRISAIVLSLVLVFSMMYVSADNSSIKIEIDTGEAIFANAAPEDIAYIDFSQIDEVDTTNGNEGNGLKLMQDTTISNTSWASSNRLDTTGNYLLLGKEAKATNDEATTFCQGHVFINLTASKTEKANKSYAVKVDYFGGGVGFDNGSYIQLYYRNRNNSDSSIKNVVGTTLNSGKIESTYYLLEDANLSETFNSPKADVRLTTYSGAQLWISKISIVEYEPIVTPEVKEVMKGGNEIKSIDFSKIGAIDTTNGNVGNGIKLVQDAKITNTSWASANRLDETGNYLLLGKEAKATNAEATTFCEGHVFINLTASKTEKANKSYAVKVDYFGGGVGFDNGSYIQLYYRNRNNSDSSIKNVVGTTLNSGKIETAYYLLPDANLSETFNSPKADIRLTTYGTAQLWISKISIVEYDASATVSDAATLFNSYSGGPIPENVALLDSNTGEYSGISYNANTPVYRLTDTNGNVNYVSYPAEYNSTNKLYAYTMKIADTDTVVKNTKNAVITISYWDTENEGDFQLKYDTAADNWKGHDTIEFTGTNSLKSHSFTLTDAEFKGGQTGGSDFRFNTYKNLYVSKIKVEAINLEILRKELLGTKDATNFDHNGDKATNVVDLFLLKKNG